MTGVALFELTLLLMAVIIGLELLARRLRLPPAAAFILGGGALAFVPGAPAIDLDPDLALVLFLPPLLASSAYATVWRDFRANLRIILQLAVGAVAFTTFCVGVVAHWAVPSLPWAACFALGAIVSPPDSVAAKAVLQGLSLPPRITVLLEGESLVNDASGLVLYRFAVAAALTGTFDAGQAFTIFGLLALGGVAAGAALGWCVTILLQRLRDPTLGVVISFLAAWAAYIGGEALHVSGVLATVACGLVIGWRQHTVLSAETRTQALAVWRVAVFVLESLVFILIGLSLRGVLQRLGGNWEAVHILAPTVSVIVAAVILTRFAWIIPATYVPRALSPALAPSRSLSAAFGADRDELGRDAGRRQPGRGACSAGELPGSRFHHRHHVRRHSRDRLGARGDPGAADPRLASRQLLPGLGQVDAGSGGRRPRGRRAVRRGRTALDRDGDGNTHRHPRLVEQYRSPRQSGGTVQRGGRRADRCQAGAFHGGAGGDFRRASRAHRLHRDGSIHDSVLHALERKLDLEELTARRHLDGK